MDETAAENRPARRSLWALVVAGLVLVALIVAGALVLWPRPQPEAAPAPMVTSARPSATPTPSPTPTPTGFPRDDAAYDVSALPQADVFALIPALRVDDAPDAPFAGYAARSVGPAAPVWADPLAEPVAALPRDFTYDGTTVAVIEKQEHWVRVLLTGRQALPSAGDPRQLTGWLRTADVELTPTDATIEVSLSAKTIDIVRGGSTERIADDFAWGTTATPTPLGRSFVMMVTKVPSFSYTRGHPIVYLSVQSPTLDGFGGAESAVTAFHYHDARSGAISNGCIRVSAEVTAKLAELPLGTGVHIRE